MMTMKKLISFTLAFFLCVMPVSGYVWADETADLKKEVNDLKAKLIELEKRLVATESRSDSQDKKVSEGLATGSVSGPIATGLSGLTKDISLHGYVDTSYIFNTNTPTSPNPRINRLRVFDRDSNGFMLNMAKVYLEKTVSKESPIGGRVDLDFGKDAEIIGSAGLGSTTDEFDLQQAYGEVQVPYSFKFMDALKFKAGKYSTLLGAEVIESPDNWNFSRSFLFGYAIPFTLTGLRAYYKPMSDVPVDIYAGINNGWDVVSDNNKGKTFEGQINFYPTDKFSMSLGTALGPERSDSNNDMRNVIDLVATYKATNKLTFKVNYDYGWERNGTGEYKNASWSGVAGYAKYDILDWWSLAARGEFFNDMNGVRTGMLASNGNTNIKLCEGTLTSEFRIFKDLITRLEYRYDKANEAVFYKNKEYSNHQNTISAEAIYKF